MDNTHTHTHTHTHKESPRAFRWYNQKAMFTYKYHLPKEDLYGHFKSLVEDKGVVIKWMRAAHENGDEETPYQHTHLLVDFGKRWQTTNVRYFDIEGDDELLHPHIKIVRNMTHWNNCVEYLAKEDPENKDLLPKANYDTVSQILNCESRLEAIEIGAGKRGENVLGAINAAKLYDYRERPRPEFPEPQWSKWQVELNKELDNPPNPRKIIWYYDPKGATGKTTYARWKLCDDPQRVSYVAECSGPYHMATFIQGELDRGCNPHVMFVNISRLKMLDTGMYKTMEQVKDGIMNTLKYQGKLLMFNPPHIVCFANFLPDIEHLSEDRWDIREIKNGDALPLTLKEVRALRDTIKE